MLPKYYSHEHTNHFYGNKQVLFDNDWDEGVNDSQIISPINTNIH